MNKEDFNNLLKSSLSKYSEGRWAYFSEVINIIKQESEFEAKPDYAYTFEMNEDHGHINFTIAEDGTYAIVTEHVPSESNMQIFDENQVELLPIIEHEVEGHSH